MPGSPAANQGKTEPMPPTQGHGDPDAAPDPTTVERPKPDGMTVGAADPQAPSHDGAAGATAQPSLSGTPSEQNPVLSGELETDMERSAQNTSVVGTSGTTSGPGDGRGVPVTSDEAAPGTSQDSAVAQGSRTPE
jgi:hypothetical protein